MSDSIQTDANALRHIADNIEQYKTNQILIIENYLRDIDYAYREWQDVKYRELIDTVRRLHRVIEKLGEDLRPLIQLLNEKADQIHRYNIGGGING